VFFFFFPCENNLLALARAMSQVIAQAFSCGFQCTVSLSLLFFIVIIFLLMKNFLLVSVDG